MGQTPMLREKAMSDAAPNHPDRSLSEISHLFLSSIRDRTTAGAARPQRTPPPKSGPSDSPRKSQHTIDLTPEEFAQVWNDDTPQTDDGSETADRGLASVPPVTAVIAGHLGGKPIDRVKEYARHLASTGQRIGLIELDASEFRVMLFDRDVEGPSDEQTAECSFDPRRMNEVLEELSWDVSRWLMVLPTPRVPEARALLRDSSRWLLLSTCDHDGVIACYRTLKGLTDLWPAGPEASRPALSVALLDAPDDEQAQRVADKLINVCRQFLHWPLEAEPAIRPTDRVGEHLVMCCRSTRDKGQLANAPQWEIMTDFLARSKKSPAPAPVTVSAEEDDALETHNQPDQPELAHAKNEPDMPEPIAHPAMRPLTLHPTPTMPEPPADDVIDLPTSDSSEGAIIDAVLRHSAAELVECPLTPPMCPRAKLAVGRNHRVVLLAVARQGLSDLSAIGQAFRWLQENQTLIGMAVPQLSIDVRQPPQLELLVNQSDSAAETLQPMLEGGHVTVKTYRKLRWGGRMGLLLEAA